MKKILVMIFGNWRLLKFRLGIQGLIFLALALLVTIAATVFENPSMAVMAKGLWMPFVVASCLAAAMTAIMEKQAVKNEDHILSLVFLGPKQLFTCTQITESSIENHSASVECAGKCGYRVGLFSYLWPSLIPAVTAAYLQGAMVTHPSPLFYILHGLLAGFFSFLGYVFLRVGKHSCDFFRQRLQQ